MCQGKAVGSFPLPEAARLDWGWRRACAAQKLTQQSPWGKGWVAAVSSLTPPTTPRSTFSGVLPSQASFPKTQAHLLGTADLRPQLSHLLQEKLHLLVLLRQQSAQVPAGTRKQILSESGPSPLRGV